MSAVIANFGLGNAFLHRSEETNDEQFAAAVHFTLQLVFSSTWAASLLGYAVFGVSGDYRWALVVLTITSVGSQLTHTPHLILRRRVVHRRLALYQVIDVLTSSAVAVGLAWQGLALWALLSTDIVTVILKVVLFYIWRPIWRPRLLWNWKGMAYFLRFGVQQVLADGLVRALDRIDDLWVGTYLGETAMGFYSRAYTFANYPSRIVAAPVNQVILGTYAELKSNRQQLSQAFFRANALLVRSGFLVAGILVLISPEFIRIALTEKWMPSLDTFRLMLLYTLFDPVRVSLSALFVAVGRPNQVVVARVIQLLVLIVGLFAWGATFGINGVAIAVDLMLLVGIVSLLWRARAYVDYSVLQLLGIPLLATGGGMALAVGGHRFFLSGCSDWLTGGFKGAVFCFAYLGALALFERENFDMILQWTRRYYADRVPAFLTGS